MIRELLAIFREDNPLASMGKDFSTMLKTAYEMTEAAGHIYFDKKASPEVRTKIYKQDVVVNKLERSIRKSVASHVTVSNSKSDVPYCLLLMSLVKDVERLGDYAKNISEVIDICPDPLPDDDVVKELNEIRKEVEEKFKVVSDIFGKSDRDTAASLLREGVDIAHRCDTLIARIAKGGHTSSHTTALVLGVRYYKRISGHLQNVLSSVVMPLHKLDYYDEDEITNAG
jgi:phosphate uptake regulator